MITETDKTKATYGFSCFSYTQVIVMVQSLQVSDLKNKTTQQLKINCLNEVALVSLKFKVICKKIMHISCVSRVMIFRKSAFVTLQFLTSGFALFSKTTESFLIVSRQSRGTPIHNKQTEVSSKRRESSLLSLYTILYLQLQNNWATVV